MVLGVSLRNISTSPFLATTHSFRWNSSAVAVNSPPYWIVQSQSPRFQRSVWSNFMRQLVGSPSMTSMVRLEAAVVVVPTAEMNVLSAGLPCHIGFAPSHRVSASAGAWDS